MKNQIRKDSYLSTLTEGKRKSFTTHLISIGKYEDVLDKDIAEMSTDELQKYLSTRSATRYQNMTRYIISIRDYLEWCIANNICVASNPEILDPSDNTLLDTIMFDSPSHLHQVLDQIFGDSDDDTVSCIYKSYYWLAYIGIRAKDALLIPVSSIDLQRMKVWYCQQLYNIPNAAYEDFRKAVGTTEFNRIQPLQDKVAVFKTKRVDGELLFRTSRSTALSKNTIRAATNAKRNQSSMFLEYDFIRLSGLFYNVYTTEQSGALFDFTQYVIDDLTAANKTFQSFSARQQYVRSQIKEYKNDYKRWKDVFYPDELGEVEVTGIENLI